ncbi:MAG: hypothetical protein M1831_006523 [Alyxoria varia]|nr:MAG: hypothetical protein M1831_006523 [Alyxoria varia]
MNSSKTLAIFGATGAQGGAVLETMINVPGWKLRAFTRDPNSSKGKALTDRGVEVVKADLSDEEQLKSALAGAYAVFLVTNYWEIRSTEGEKQQVRNAVHAAQHAGVQHFLYSSSGSPAKITNGRITGVHHFEGKYEAELYIASTGIPCTFIQVACYMSNMPGGMLRYDSNGKNYTLALPMPGDRPIAMIDAWADTGKFVKAALLHRDQLLGKNVYASSGYVTPEQMLETFKKVYPESGNGAKFVQAPREGFKGALAQKVGEQGAEDLTQMFEFIGDSGYYGGAELETSLGMLDEKPKSWEDFVRTAPAWQELS